LSPKTAEQPQRERDRRRLKWNKNQRWLEDKEGLVAASLARGKAASARKRSSGRPGLAKKAHRRPCRPASAEEGVDKQRQGDPEHLYVVGSGNAGRVDGV
jgi:hypothetical protein